MDTNTVPQELGALPDTRSPEQIAQDFHINEIVASAVAVDWKEIPKDQIRVFGNQFQGQKSDCVAETRRKLKRILFKVNKGIDLDFSAAALYRQRSNYPDPGMGAADVISLDRNKGMTLDQLVPSDPLSSEAAANALQVEAYNADIAKVFTVPNEVTFTAGDLQTPAGTIQTTRKGIMMWFSFTDEEWSREVPIIIDSSLKTCDTRALRHSVTGVEPALYNGKRGVWVDDSAPFGGLSRRFVTEEFYNARNFWASYPISLQFEPQNTAKPSFDGSTKSLQDCLKYEGLFPSNVDSTGVYGSITTQSVKKFQAKYGLEQVGTVGPLTTAKLHQIYP